MGRSHEILQDFSIESAEGVSAALDATVDYLREPDPKALKVRLFNRLQALPQLRSKNLRAISHGYDVAQKVHLGQKRQQTGRPYMNHPLQDSLVVTHLLPKNRISQHTINVGLLHDTIEEGEETRETLLEKRFETREVYGVYIMTNKINGRKLDKPEHLDRIFEAHEVNPTLELIVVSAADLTVNALDPVTREELVKREGIEQEWRELREKKTMQIEYDLIPRLPEDAQYLTGFLKHVAGLARLTLEPEFTLENWKERLQEYMRSEGKKV